MCSLPSCILIIVIKSVSTNFLYYYSDYLPGFWLFVSCFIDIGSLLLLGLAYSAGRLQFWGILAWWHSNEWWDVNVDDVAVCSITSSLSKCWAGVWLEGCLFYSNKCFYGAMVYSTRISNQWVLGSILVLCIFIFFVIINNKATKSLL